MKILSIENEDYLLRRVPITPSYIKPDGSITSFAFNLKPNEDGISVDLERLTNHAAAILDASRFKLIRINAGFIRNNINDGLDCTHDPQEGNYAHSLITSNNAVISKSKSRAMAANAEII